MECKNTWKNRIKGFPHGIWRDSIQKIDEEGTRKLLQDMVKWGINYIDSARGYTVSEQYIGYGLEGIRDQFVLATKSMARTKEAMAADIETSLRISAQTILICIRHAISMNSDQVIGEGGALGCWRRKILKDRTYRNRAFT